jgi:hypothetical protein
MNDVSDIQNQRTECGRITALGRRTDSGERCTLLVIQETDGAWSFYGLGALWPGRARSAAVETKWSPWPSASWSVPGELVPAVHRRPRHAPGHDEPGQRDGCVRHPVVPRTIAFGRKELSGEPPDPQQICPRCQSAQDIR